MSEVWVDIEDAPLYGEHLLLGGTFAEDESRLASPLHYGDPADLAAFAEGCALCDLSGMSNILVSGKAADAFVAAACANRPLDVGECAFGAVVTGDGSIASVPLVARTGDAEYLILDASERGLMLHPWMSFLSDIEQDGYRPFGDVQVEDVSDSLVPMLLWGPKAKAVLADYVPTIEALPRPGHVANTRLDRIECLIARLPRYGAPCYFLLVPPAAARVLWRSFLSFVMVSPVGSSQLARHATDVMPWMADALQADRLVLELEQLLAWELARETGGYVGARALGA